MVRFSACRLPVIRQVPSAIRYDWAACEPGRRPRDGGERRWHFAQPEFHFSPGHPERCDGSPRDKEVTWDLFVVWQRGKTPRPLRALLDALRLEPEADSVDEES